MKTCTKCGEDKALKDFNKDPSQKSGYRPSCKACKKEYRKLHYQRTKDKQSEQMKEWYQNNKTRAMQKSREWCRNNPDKKAASAAKRRALLRRQSPEITKLENSMIKALYFISKVLSNSCDDQYHVDHIKPISKGGLHTFNNLQILTAVENKTKAAKMEVYY